MNMMQTTVKSKSKGNIFAKSGKFIPVPDTGVESELTLNNVEFQKLLDQVSTNYVKEGTVVKGKVVGVSNEIIVVDVGLGSEGRISAEEFKSEGEIFPAVGDIVDVYIVKQEGRDHNPVLSRKKAIADKLWEELEERFSKNENIIGVITDRVKGGFVVNLGSIEAFLPGSQVDVKQVKDIGPLMNISQPFQILKMDKKHDNIVVSRRAILEESRAGEKSSMLATIKEGMLLTGTVKNITDYGAFVDLGSVDGLLHLTDMSWGRLNHPSEMLTIGQKIEVMVIKFNEENKRISLGLKQLDINPWLKIPEQFPVGKTFNGRISNIADYGVFIELVDGIEGLVHSSEIKWGKNNRHNLIIGDEVEFKILEIDVQKHRVSLSIKQTKSNPFIAFAENYKVGDIVNTIVKTITETNVIVHVNDEIEGAINIGDLTWDEEPKQELLRKYKRGDEIKCIILSIDPDKERIRLGTKQLSSQPADYISPPAEFFHKDKVIEGKIVKINEEGIVLELELARNEGTIEGFIKPSESLVDLSDIDNLPFNSNDYIKVKVINFDKKLGRVNLTMKDIKED